MELEIAIVQARKSPLAKNLGRDEVMKMLTAGISHSAMVRGQDVSLNGKTFIANEVYDEVFKKHTDLRIEEIPIVFKNGVYGRYGEYFGINALTIVKWFEEYLSSDERLNARNKEKQQSVVMIAHDESEEARAKRNDDAMRESAMRFYKESQENGGVIHALDGLKARVFDYLVKIGKIKNAEERIDVALKEVKEIIRHKSSKMNRGINQVNSLIEAVTNMGDRSLIPQAKARILDKFYKALYDTGRELRL